MQQDQATQRRVTLKRSSRWDRQRSGSTQSKHRDRSASFPPLRGRLFPQVITAIVQLEGAYLCYYSARSTGGEATWIYSFRNSFCGGAGEYAGRDYQHYT
ncbi:hypothetical protein MTO96_046754 [Rhipicephalus appendiculatus]